MHGSVSGTTERSIFGGLGDQSQHSLGRTSSKAQSLPWSSREKKVSLSEEVFVSLESTLLSTQIEICWNLPICICVFSRSHSPLMADLLVRYLLKTYIFTRVCFIALLLESLKYHDGVPWQNIAFKINFRFSCVIYEWVDVFIVANSTRFSLQHGMVMRPTMWSRKV